MNDITLPFAERMRRGELLLGTVISIPSPELTETLAHCGFDWLFIDAEHGSFNPQEALPLLQAAASCPCLVRVPAHDEVWLKKALDIGASGVIVPQVHTAEQARQIVEYCKYTPEGSRGMGVSRASQYGLNLGSYIDTANRSTAVVLQAEHEAAARNIEAIVSVDGVDAILVGPFDMSASVGKPGQTSDPEVVALFDAVTRACKKAGVTLGTAVAGPDDAKTFIEKGYTLVSAGVDSLHLIKSAKKMIADVKSKR